MGVVTNAGGSILLSTIFRSVAILTSSRTSPGVIANIPGVFTWGTALRADV